MDNGEWVTSGAPETEAEEQASRAWIEENKAAYMNGNGNEVWSDSLKKEVETESQRYQGIYNASFNHGVELAGGTDEMKVQATEPFQEAWLLGDDPVVADLAQNGINDGKERVSVYKQAGGISK